MGRKSVYAQWENESLRAGEMGEMSKCRVDEMGVNEIGITRYMASHANDPRSSYTKNSHYLNAPSKDTQRCFQVVEFRERTV